uniref:Uncharacterized protein n=1 Tax=Rhizophora mucronata TaxID=61149 RepID=A0A2P2PBI7_RHIMU
MLYKFFGVPRQHKIGSVPGLGCLLMNRMYIHCFLLYGIVAKTNFGALLITIAVCY